jgi:hypothetical protein
MPLTTALSLTVGDSGAGIFSLHNGNTTTCLRRFRGRNEQLN